MAGLNGRMTRLEQRSGLLHQTWKLKLEDVRRLLRGERVTGLPPAQQATADDIWHGLHGEARGDAA